MDVVFNHTAEGNQQGPCISLRHDAPQPGHPAGHLQVRSVSRTMHRVQRWPLPAQAAPHSRPTCRLNALRRHTEAWTTASSTCWRPGESTTTTAAAATLSTATTPSSGASCWTACATGSASTTSTASGGRPGAAMPPGSPHSICEACVDSPAMATTPPKSNAARRPLPPGGLMVACVQVRPGRHHDARAFTLESPACAGRRGGRGHRCSALMDGPCAARSQRAGCLTRLVRAGYLTEGAGCPTGTPLAVPPLVEMISEDPLLRSTKLIAEAWDCDGLNQVRALQRPAPGLLTGRDQLVLPSVRGAARQVLSGPLAGGSLPALWRPLGRVERPVPRRCAPVRQGALLGAGWGCTACAPAAGLTPAGRAGHRGPLGGQVCGCAVRLARPLRLPCRSARCSGPPALQCLWFHPRGARVRTAVSCPPRCCCCAAGAPRARGGRGALRAELAAVGRGGGLVGPGHWPAVARRPGPRPLNQLCHCA